MPDPTSPAPMPRAPTRWTSTSTGRSSPRSSPSTARPSALAIERFYPYIRPMTEYQHVTSDMSVYRDGTIKLHGPEGFEGMRKAGRLAAEILDALAPLVQPGVSTEALDRTVREMTLDGGGVPATMGYRGYTHSCCISINHVVCHGIPSAKTLKDGDIVNIDVTPLLDGWHGDSSRMYLVGEVGLKARRLVEVTHECLMLGS